MLTAQWTRRLPLLQRQAPAELAAALIEHHLALIEHSRPSNKAKVLPLSVVDFCSGAGGPSAYIEKQVNSGRQRQGQAPISFQLSDLHPHLDAWMELAEHSTNLAFIPQSVSAAAPPPSAISSAAMAPKIWDGDYSSSTRVFRTYYISFHHFDDAMAVAVLKSTLETSDGFAIVELQDRRIASLVLMVLEFFLMFLVTAIWFGGNGWHLAFTYVIPVLPWLQAFDGFISALRTRTFDEVMKLVDGSLGENDLEQRRGMPLSADGQDQLNYRETSDWVFEGGRVIHTYPFGYMNWVVGRRIHPG